MATVELTSAKSRSNGKAAQRIERVRATMETDLRTLSAKKGDERDCEIASTLKQAYSRLTAATALASLCDQRATPPSPISVAGSGAKSSSSDDFHHFGRIEGDKMEEIASNRIAAIDEPSYFRGDISLTFPQKNWNIHLLHPLTPRGRHLVPPMHLMEILDEEDNEGVIAWLPHGKSFTICNRRKFTSEVMPKYFGNSKYSSFIRKLNRWGFVQNGIGAQDGAYHHVDFQRGRRNLCAQIRSRAATKFRVDSAPNSPMNSKNSLKQNRSIENEHLCNHGVQDASPQHVRNGGTYGDAALQLHPTIFSPHSRSISIENLVSVNSLRNCVLSSSRIQQIGQVAMSNMSPLGSSRVAESTTMQIDPGSISGGLVRSVMPKTIKSTPKQFNDPFTLYPHAQNFSRTFPIGKNHHPALVSVALEIRSRTDASSLNHSQMLPWANAA